MPLDLSKIKNRLEELKTNKKKTANLWKPNPGTSVVRIIPYAHNPENPFIELHFHYGLNGKNYLSPSSFSRPDPIVEFSDKLKESGDKQQWLIGRKLEPKMRTYVPILVRGQEDEGVKFWGMGKQVYEAILAIIADPDYGDITDLRNGRDIAVEFIPKEKTGKSFPETKIRAKPNVTPAFDPSDTALKEKIKNQPKVTELYPELSYEQLAVVLDEWLNASKEETEVVEVDVDTAPAQTSSEDAPAVPTKEVAKATTPVKSATAKNTVKTPTSKEVADQFEDLFNS